MPNSRSITHFRGYGRSASSQEYDKERDHEDEHYGSDAYTRGIFSGMRNEVAHPARRGNPATRLVRLGPDGTDVRALVRCASYFAELLAAVRHLGEHDHPGFVRSALRGRRAGAGACFSSHFDCFEH